MCPKGEIRPAMDRVRESVFSILGDLTGQSFLDLFSGSGVIGIEAASRGAAPVVCVEGDGKKKAVLSQNLSMVETEKTLIISSAEKYLKTCGRAFDLIFLDPPFPYKKKEQLLEMIDTYAVLKPEGRMLIHYPAEDRLPERTEGLLRDRLKKYGRSLVAFYRPDTGASL